MSPGAVIGGGLLLVLAMFAGIMVAELTGSVDQFFIGMAVIGGIAALLMGYSGAFVPGASTLPIWGGPAVLVYVMKDTHIRPSARILYGAAATGVVLLGLIFLATWG